MLCSFFSVPPWPPQKFSLAPSGPPTKYFLQAPLDGRQHCCTTLAFTHCGLAHQLSAKDFYFHYHEETCMKESHQMMSLFPPNCLVGLFACRGEQMCSSVCSSGLHLISHCFCLWSFSLQYQETWCYGRKAANKALPFW